jgi:hypothetical protein
MPQGYRAWRSMALAILYAQALSGCAAERLQQSNAQIIPFHQDGDPVITFDPLTGTKARTTKWQYADGYKTETVERVPIHGANDFARNVVEPAIRVTDD